MSCSDDDKSTISLDQTEVILKNGETYQINASSENTITYTSEHVYHALVSATGLVTANKVGETTILLTDGESTKSVKVIVEPRYYLYAFPSMSFGMTKNEVIGKLGNPDSDKPEMLVYMIDYIDNVTAVGCYFDSTDYMYACHVKLKSATAAQIAAFLNERYELMTNTSGGKAYFDALTLQDATMMVFPQLQSNSWIVTHSIFGSK